MTFLFTLLLCIPFHTFTMWNNPEESPQPSIFTMPYLMYPYYTQLPTAHTTPHNPSTQAADTILSIQPIYQPHQTTYQPINNEKAAEILAQKLDDAFPQTTFGRTILSKDIESFFHTAVALNTENQCNEELYTILYDKSTVFAKSINIISAQIKSKLQKITTHTINTISTQLCEYTIPEIIKILCLKKALEKTTTTYIIPLSSVSLGTPMGICDTTDQAAFAIESTVPQKRNIILIDLTTNTTNTLVNDIAVSAVKFNPSGTHLAIADETENVTIYCPYTKQLLYTIPHPRPIFTVKFTTPRGYLLALTKGNMVNPYQYISIPNDPPHIYNTPEYLETTPSDLNTRCYPVESQIYTLTEKSFLSLECNIEKYADYNFTICKHAVTNSSRDFNNICSSPYYKNLTRFEKNLIKNLIEEKRKKRDQR